MICTVKPPGAAGAVHVAGDAGVRVDGELPRVPRPVAVDRRVSEGHGGGGGGGAGGGGGGGGGGGSGGGGGGKAERRGPAGDLSPLPI